MKKTSIALLSLITCLGAFAAEENKPYPLGYSDTPLIPGTKWKVHDIDRPHPPAVSPGARLGDAPADAIILFNGKDTSQFYSLKKDNPNQQPCPWVIENGELLVNGGDCWTKLQFASCQLHLEWKSHPTTKGNSQKKGNGGVFFMDRYESQMLDCDNNPTYADGMAGSVYGQTPPLVNAVRKAGEWQVYDIVFTAPKLQNGKVVEPARITTFLNGVCVQNNTAIMGPTKHKQTTDYSGVFPEKAPLRFQDHKNEPPIRMRNIWVRPLP
ncbi:MAG: DUF1080 domain-containing protein [Verrucomicrobia bacterium]|nr:DUF1080 domain-containing protein [Verrucomicrobiota bacterium]